MSATYLGDTLDGQHLCPVCWPTTTLRIDLGAA